MGFDLSEAEVSDLLRVLDLDGDGRVSSTDWSQSIRNAERLSQTLVGRPKHSTPAVGAQDGTSVQPGVVDVQAHMEYADQGFAGRNTENVDDAMAADADVRSDFDAEFKKLQEDPEFEMSFLDEALLDASIALEGASVQASKSSVLLMLFALALWSYQRDSILSSTGSKLCFHFKELNISFPFLFL